MFLVHRGLWSRTCFQNKLWKVQWPLALGVLVRCCRPAYLLAPFEALFTMRTGAFGGILQLPDNHIIRSVTVTMDTAGCQQSGRLSEFT
jgi:hypothetical protein